MRFQNDIDAITRLLPMHMIISKSGYITASGPTMRKLIGDARQLGDIASLQRPHTDLPGNDGMMAALLLAARSGERIFLRMKHPRSTVLRGHASPLGREGEVLLNLGFGIGLVDAVRRFGLTDADFSPDDLAMELLFLHEANRAVLAELSGFNVRLDEARRDAEVQAFTDPLTGLSNRRACDLAMNMAMARLGSACGGNDFALAHVDLDHFKQVNDRFGHAAGDAVLCHVAGLMCAATRAQDTVSRTGGDEFVLILPGVLRRSALDALFSRLIAQIEQPIVTAHGVARISASIGVAFSSDFSNKTPAEFHRAADAALYVAKAAGRGCWRQYEAPATVE